MKAVNFEKTGKIKFGERKTKTLQVDKIDKSLEQKELEMSKKEYDSLPNDYKGTINNKKYAVVRNKETGRTEYVPVNIENESTTPKYKKDDEVEVEIKTDKKYANYIKPHLEEEHPKTKGHIKIEKQEVERPEYHKYNTFKGTHSQEKLTYGKNEEVNNAFLYGRTAKSHSLTTKDNKLYSYDTIIAEKTGSKEITITNKKYSVTTSKQVSQLQRQAEKEGFTINKKSQINDNKKYKKELKRTEKISDIETKQYKDAKEKNFTSYKNLTANEKEVRRQYIYDHQGMFQKVEQTPKGYDEAYKKILNK